MTVVMNVSALQLNLMRCHWCKEVIIPGRDSVHSHFQHPTHWECGLRAMLGSIAHVRQLCDCYVKGSKDDDPPGLTMRQSASLVAAWVNQQEHPETVGRN